MLLNSLQGNITTIATNVNGEKHILYVTLLQAALLSLQAHLALRTRKEGVRLSLAKSRTMP